MPKRITLPTKTAANSFLRGHCNAEAVITAGVNGNGGGIKVAANTVTPALFSILDLSCSMRRSLRKCSKPFSPAFRINRSITKTPTTDPMAEASTYAIQTGLLRSELIKPMSSRSFPNGSTRNEESRALMRKRPNNPSLRKKRSTQAEALIANNRRRGSGKAFVPYVLLVARLILSNDVTAANISKERRSA